MGELHRKEDVGGSVARRLYADAVPLDGNHDVTRFCDGRRHIIRNHRNLVEMAPVFPDPIHGFTRAGRLHETGRTVGSQIDIAEFKQADARGAGRGDGSATHRRRFEGFSVGENVANAERAQYVRIDREGPQVVGMGLGPGGCEQPQGERMRLYRRPLTIFFEGRNIPAPQIGFREGFAVACAEEVTAIVVAPGVIEARLIGTRAQLAGWVQPDGCRVAAKRFSDSDRRMFLQVVAKRSIAGCRDLIANAKGEVNERQDRKYRQDHSAAPWNAVDGGGWVHWTFVAMRRAERDGDDDSAEGADSDQQLPRPVMTEAVGMAQHAD